MHKNRVIEELEDVISTLKQDKRTNLKGLKVMVCETDWNKRFACPDSNLFVEWKM